MTLTEFMDYGKDDYIYTPVDASKQGYLSNPLIARLHDGGNRPFISSLYGNWEFVGFDIATKKRLYVYIKR